MNKKKERIANVATKMHINNSDSEIWYTLHCGNCSKILCSSDKQCPGCFCKLHIKGEK